MKSRIFLMLHLANSLFAKFFQRIFVVFFLLSVFVARAGHTQSNYVINYQGRILDDSGKPLVSSKVNFIFSIIVRALDNQQCLLYSENVSGVDMSTGAGAFSVNIGSGVRTDASTIPLQDLFNPYLVVDSSGQCQPGYIKKPGDKMYLQVAFDDGSGYQGIDPLEIAATPYSMETINVAGVPSGNVLRVDSPAGQTLLTTQKFNDLLSLIEGTSTKYVRNTGGGGGGVLLEGDIPTLVSAGKVVGSAITSGTIGGTTAINTTGNLTTSGYVSANALSARQLSLANAGGSQVTLVAPGSFSNYQLALPVSSGSVGQVLTSDGGGNLIWGNGASSNFVSSLTAGAGLLGGTITSAGTLTVDVGTTANKIVQLDSSAQLPAVSGVNLTNLNASNLTTGTIPLALLPASATAWLDGGAGKLYYNGGNVGIGATNPSAPLQLGKLLTPPALNAPVIVGQSHVNDNPSQTAAGSEVSSLVVTQPNPSSDSNQKFFGTVTDFSIPAGNSANFLTTLVSSKSYLTFAGTGTVTQAYGGAAQLSNISSGTITQAYGFGVGVNNTSDGSLTSAFALRTAISNTGIGNISKAYGIYLRPIDNSGGGTISDTYGLYLGSQTGGVQSNAPFGIYQEGKTDRNYFAGNVGIGTTAPNAPLQVSATNTATSGTNFHVQLTPTYNQTSGSAANTDLLINRTQTAVGSGTQRLIDAQVGGTSKFSVDNLGNLIAAGTITAASITGSSTSSNNLAGGAAGSIPYQSSPGNTTMLAIGGSGSLLTSTGSGPQWTTTLPVANGGTGTTSLIGILLGNGTGAMTSATAGTHYSVPSGIENFTGAKTFDYNKLLIKGNTGGGVTTLNSTNTTATNYSLTFPAIDDTVVTFTSSGTLTNKTIDTASGNILKLNGNTLSASVGTGTLTLPNSTDTLIGRNTTDILTNKTWNGGAIGTTYGGTGLTSYATGDLLYASSANTLSKLSVGSTGQVLTISSGTVPSWTTPTGTTQWVNTGTNISYSAGNVGIGTTNPGAKLEIGGDVILKSGTNTALHLHNSSGTKTVKIDSSGPSYFNLSGGVGINTASPAVAFHVVGDGTNTASFMSGNVGIGTTTPNDKLTVAFGGGTPQAGLSLDAFSFGSGGNAIESYFFRTRDLGAGTTQFYIRGDGNVGIGTTAPSGKIQVSNSGSQYLLYSTSGYLASYAPEGSTGEVRFGAAWSRKGIYSDSDLNLLGTSGLALSGRGNNTDLYINSSGNLGIGTTVPDSKLQVNGIISNVVSTNTSFTCNGTISFSSSNFIRLAPTTTIAAGTCTTNLSDLVAGGSYTLVVTGNAATNAVIFSFAGYAFKYLPANAATSGGKDTIYTFLYDGTTVYVTWGGGYQ